VPQVMVTDEHSIARKKRSAILNKARRCRSAIPSTTWSWTTKGSCGS